VLLILALACGFRGVETLRAAATARQSVDFHGDRIYRYLAAIPEVGQAVGAKFLQPVAKSIILESVTYHANGCDLLKNCDLRIAARTSTAVISLDPAVRRAVAFLLPRFIEPQSGRVLFDSEDTAWATLESLRAETVYVGGADPFFTGTVAENLTCGDSRFSVQEAMEAAKQAHAHNFIQRLPQGYDTVIGEHGERLDAGQAFRLGLARAILRKPAVMIIEEPAETLDEDTKALLDDAYNRITRERTVIFLPTRLSTVRRCDPIVLVHDGRVAATGNHETLVRQSELYRHWEYVNFKAPQSIKRPAAV
jgi:ABC-type multidrug transport system fused ATPase/permease subunit